MDDEKAFDEGWKCKICTMDNSVYLSYCEACSSPKCDEQNATNTILNHNDTDDSKQTVATKSDWKCKLCQMDNNEYISYCETCLVPKNAQMDEKLFNQLTYKLKSMNCDQYIKADDIKGIVEKLKSDFQRLKAYQTDKQIVPEIQQQIDQLYAKMNIKNNANIVQDFIDTYNIDSYAFKKHRAANKKCHPVCKCGTEMNSLKSTKCYASEFPYVICDICDKRIAENEKVFNCPRKKVKKIHPTGFDICLKCRGKYIHRLRKFVAVIICPKMAVKHASKDAAQLQFMFKKLGFHKIICLKDDRVNKYSVENALNAVLPTGGDENVNQLTVICYSGHGEMDENGKYHFAIDPYDESTWISSDIIKTQCCAARCGAVLDGLGRYFNQFWYRTYYRHNTLLLVNSCHSGASYNFVNSQIIADSFGTLSCLTILLAPFALTPIALRKAAKKLGQYLGQSAMSCVEDYLRGEISMECLSSCFGISAAQLVLIAKITGVAIIVVIIVAVSIYKSIQKSKECESIYVIASCHKKEESNSCYGVSPFIKYVNDFFDIFLNPQQNKLLGNGYILDSQYLMDSPMKLMEYLKESYEIRDKSLGNVSLNGIGQRVCASKRGFYQFAMCPMLNKNPHKM